jgi:hypothetical protein
MNIHLENLNFQQLSGRAFRHLLTDILPTFLLLLAMAFGMAWVARYADSSVSGSMMSHESTSEQASG